VSCGCWETITTVLIWGAGLLEGGLTCSIYLHSHPHFTQRLQAGLASSHFTRRALRDVNNEQYDIINIKKKGIFSYLQVLQPVRTLGFPVLLRVMDLPWPSPRGGPFRSSSPQLLSLTEGEKRVSFNKGFIPAPYWIFNTGSKDRADILTVSCWQRRSLNLRPSGL